MINENTPQEISRLFDLVDAVEQEYSKSFSVERQSRQGELALYFLDHAGSHILYFTVRHDLWERLQNPAWFGVKTDWDEAVLSSFTQTYGEGFVNHEGFRLFPLEHNMVARDTGSENIKKLFDRYLSRFVQCGEP